eukprot:scaffold20398_cov184-Amphora_coffeaeformis.AAC.10
MVRVQALLLGVVLGIVVVVVYEDVDHGLALPTPTLSCKRTAKLERSTWRSSFGEGNWHWPSTCNFFKLQRFGTMMFG